jgi:hypothetical protein
VLVVAETQHQLAREDLEELVPSAMIVWPGSHCPRSDPAFPDRAKAVGLVVGNLHGDAGT